MRLAWGIEVEGERARACWMSTTKRAVRDMLR
jgi:hypothetical protein